MALGGAIVSRREDSTLQAEGKTFSIRGAAGGTKENSHLIGGRNFLILLMARDGIEPPTHGFSVRWPITESS